MDWSRAGESEDIMVYDGRDNWTKVQAIPFPLWDFDPLSANHEEHALFGYPTRLHREKAPDPLRRWQRLIQ
jgi:hypothetical protein